MRSTKIPACLVAPLLAFSFACGEPAGADKALKGALYKKKKGVKKITNKKPHKNLQEGVSLSKASMRAALVTRARNAGWSTPDLNALQTVLAEGVVLVLIKPHESPRAGVARA